MIFPFIHAVSLVLFSEHALSTRLQDVGLQVSYLFSTDINLLFLLKTVPRTYILQICMEGMEANTMDDDDNL